MQKAGIRSRLYGRFGARKLQKEEWESSLQVPGPQGGQECKLIDVEVEVARMRIEDAEDALQSCTLEFREIVENDLQAFRRGFRKCVKRRVVLDWLLPAGLFLLLLSPNYHWGGKKTPIGNDTQMAPEPVLFVNDEYDVQPRCLFFDNQMQFTAMCPTTTGFRVGHDHRTEAAKIYMPNLFMSAKSILLHIHRVRTPRLWHRSCGIGLGKRNNNEGGVAWRIVHLLCLLGAIPFVFAMVDQKATVRLPYDFWYLRGRPRDGAMLVVIALSHRLRSAKLNLFRSQYDMFKAFVSMHIDFLMSCVDEILKFGHVVFGIQRFSHACICISCANDSFEVALGCGGLRGNFFMVALFRSSFNKPTIEWQKQIVQNDRFTVMCSCRALAFACISDGISRVGIGALIAFRCKDTQTICIDSICFQSQRLSPHF